MQLRPEAMSRMINSVTSRPKHKMVATTAHASVFLDVSIRGDVRAMRALRARRRS